jgi:hypothetical protein
MQLNWGKRRPDPAQHSTAEQREILSSGSEVGELNHIYCVHVEMKTASDAWMN